MAEFYKRLIFGEGDSAQEFKLAVNLSGNGAPDETTAADVGMLYLDTSSEDGDLYKCIVVTVTESGKTYTWKKLGDSAIYVLKEDETVDDAPADAVIVIDPYDDTGEDEDTRYDAILATVPNKASVEGSTLKMQRETTDGDETTVTDLFEVDLPSGSGETDKAGIWEHIIDITTTEEVGSIEVTENADNVPLSELKYNEIWIIAKMVGVSTNTWSWWMCGATSDVNLYAEGAVSGGTTTTKYLSWYHFIRCNKMYCNDSSNYDAYNVKSVRNAWLDNLLDYYNSDHYVKLLFYAGTDGLIGVDSEIRIMGRRV